MNNSASQKLGVPEPSQHHWDRPFLRPTQLKLILELEEPFMRRQPAALQERVIKKLREMESDSHIVKIGQQNWRAQWSFPSITTKCAYLCNDPSNLNKVIKRKHHPMKTVEEVINNIPNATIFSVLDAKSVFLQIVLDHDHTYRRP